MLPSYNHPPHGNYPPDVKTKVWIPSYNHPSDGKIKVWIPSYNHPSDGKTKVRLPSYTHPSPVKFRAAASEHIENSLGIEDFTCDIYGAYKYVMYVF